MTEKPPSGLKGANVVRSGPGKGPAPSLARPPVVPEAGAKLEKPAELELAGGEDEPLPAVQEPEEAPVSRETPDPKPEPADIPLDDEPDTEEEAALAGERVEDEPEEDTSVGGGLFTAAELADMRKGAVAKVEKDRKAEMKLKLMQQFEDEERQRQGLAPKRGPIEDHRKMGVTIGLPPFASEIVLDNKVYFNGHTYEVTPAVFAALVDQMQHSWRHEDEINGHLNEPQRRERDTYVRGGTLTRAGAVSGAPIALNTRTSMMSRH